MGHQRVTVRLLTVGATALVSGGIGTVVTAPAGAAARTPGVSGSVAAAAACPTGPHQKAVERYLKKLGGFGAVTVDGRQSAGDCAAIKKFQRRYDIRPAAGLAGTGW